jgi:hypothetical protein
MVLAGLIALSVASSSPGLGTELLRIAPGLSESTPTATATHNLECDPLLSVHAEPLPALHRAGCRSTTPTRLSASPGPSGQLELASKGEERRWYGYQLVISDVVSIGLVLLGGDIVLHTVECSNGTSCTNSAGPALLFGGMATFGLVPPIIHLLHGQYWNAAGSLGLRVVIPVLTGLAFQGTGGMGLLWIELLVAMIVDDAYLADEPVPRVPSSRFEPGAAMAPPSHGGVGLAYGGRF